MSTIVQNQQKAFLATAQDAARRLADALQALSPAEQAALLAQTAAAAGTPVDIVFTTGEYQDAYDTSLLMDGKQLRGSTEWSWRISSGCEYQVDLLVREDTT